MKTLRPFFALFILFVAFACGDDGNNPNPNTPTETSAKVNGQSVTFSSSNSFSVGDMIAISMSSTDYAVNIFLDDKVEGVYTVQPAESGRVKTSKHAFVRVVKNDVQFDGLSGSIDVKVSVSGKISGMFSFKVKSGSQNLDFTSGTLPEITVEFPKNGSCIFNAAGVAYMTDSKSFVTCATSDIVSAIGNISDSDETWSLGVYDDSDPAIRNIVFIRNLADENSVFISFDQNPLTVDYDPSITIVKSGKQFTFSGQLENLDESKISISGVCSCSN